MLGRTHQIIGLTASLAYYLYTAPHAYNPATLAAVVGAAHIAGLLPDIDQPTGKIWTMIPLGKIFGAVVNPFLQHRNLSHSFLGIAIVTFGMRALIHRFLPAYWGVDSHQLLMSIVIAYSFHLLADMVTVEGIPLFFPAPRMYGFPPHPFQGLRILTGHWFENLIVFPLANVALWWLVWTHWPAITAILLR